MGARVHIRPGTPFHYIEHPFDRRTGLDTGGYISPRDLVTGHPHDVYVTGYSAVAPSVFREMCRRWVDTLPSRSRVHAYSFVDVGAGKGRAVLLASELSFRKIIGVELSKDLAKIATQNIERWKRNGHSRAPIRVIHQDITDFRWPRSPLLVYLYNPFERELVEELVDQLRRAGRRGSSSIDVLYLNPVFGYVLTRGSVFKQLWNERINMSLEDQNADPYATSTDIVTAYRLA